MAKMSIDDKLGVDKFTTDEHESHILINEDYADASSWHVRQTCITMKKENSYSATKAASNVVHAAYCLTIKA